MSASDPTILLTRPRAASERFAETLAKADVSGTVILSPVLRIETLPFDTPNGIKGAIFTSKNGVAAVEGRDLPCWCVGDATAEAAQARGWLPQSATGNVEDLMRRILADAPDGPLVHFRGKFARGNLADRLSAEGIETGDLVVYQQVGLPLNAQAKEALGSSIPVILPLFSPRSAAQVVQQGPFSAPVICIAMSDAVAAEAVALCPRELIVSQAPDAASMVAAIRQGVIAACAIERDENSA